MSDSAGFAGQQNFEQLFRGYGIMAIVAPPDSIYEKRQSVLG
jgi:hypothetical protein